jgi:hypothetical protein
LDGRRHPAEELNKIERDHFYGWPFLWADKQRNPERDPKQFGLGTYEDWQKKATGWTLTYAAHSAPMQMAFYTGGQFQWNTKAMPSSQCMATGTDRTPKGMKSSASTSTKLAGRSRFRRS